MSRDRYPVSPMVHWLALQKTRHVFAKHCRGVTSLHMCKLHGHKETTAAVSLAVCVLRVLPSNGFTCHNIYIYYTMLGTRWNLVAPLLVHPVVWTFHLRPRLNFLWERNELISLITEKRSFNLDNLYSKPRCHVVSNASSTSKNTAP
jgi:hypothetical protein